jgi:hypothetical protein
VNCFVFTKGAGNTEPGEPYVVKWKDENGNTRHRDVPRPDVVAKYYKNSNTIDVFNQSRQFDLRLEKHWVTEDGYFRLITTLFGIVVTDCWKPYQFHIHSNHRHKGMEIQEFAKILAKDLLENKYTTTAQVDNAFSLITNNNALTPVFIDIQDRSESNSPSTTINDIFSSTASTLTRTYVTEEMLLLQQEQQHKVIRCLDKVKHSVSENEKVRTGIRVKRGKCMMCGLNTSYIAPDVHHRQNG